MKRIYLILLAVWGISLSSCVSEKLENGRGGAEREVEISISTSGNPATRSPLDGEVTDDGDTNENRIDELDLLVFDKDGKYMYRREAYKLAGSSNRTYRARLSEYWQEMTIHFLANSRTILTTLEADATNKPVAGTTTWDQLKVKLIDTNPARLVNSTTYQALPMWGTGKITLDPNVAPNKMSGTIEMLRSVASFDVYVLDGSVPANTATKDFVFTDLYAVYAADQGYLAAIDATTVTTPKTYAIPTAMKTSAGNSQQLHANSLKVYTTTKGQFKGIAYQMYAYDNYFNTVTTDLTKHPTRLIVAGNYKGASAKSYYPIDITYNDTGEYRPVIRNWKYEFMVTSVSGPGEDSFDKARDAHNTDMNIEIIQWNKSDVEIGVVGKYYASMDRRDVTLWRDALASHVLELDYRFLDNVTDNDFTIDFKKNEAGTAYAFSNGTVVLGTPTTVDGVTTTVIKNEWFEVTMKQTPGTGRGDVSFEFKALQDYKAGNDRDVVVVKYRNLEFEISIDQLDMSKKDWDEGGVIPADF